MSEEKIFRTSEPRSCKITQKSPEKKFTGQKKIPPAAGTFPPFFYVRVTPFLEILCELGKIMRVPQILKS